MPPITPKLRLGPGPVFAYEWLTTTRRWQLFAMRSLFVGAILIGMIVAWQTSNRSTNPRRPVSLRILAAYGENLYKATVVIELTLILVAAPAATAGAICLDKARGTLDHILATDLSSAEIVVGKLGVRLVPVLGLISCILPITALTGLLGGIDTTAVVGSFLTAVACATLGCSLALTLSVWGRKTHEVLMTTYLILILWLMFPFLLDIIADLSGIAFSRGSSPSSWKVVARSNPYYLVYAPYSDPGEVGVMTYVVFLVICLFLSALLVRLATRNIRGVALAQAGRPVADGGRRRISRQFITLFSWWPALPGPSLDDNPVLWRAWHRSRPSWFSRVVWIQYSALGVLWIVVALNSVIGPPGIRETIAMITMVQVSLGYLLLSVSAATSLADERAQGRMDVLLCTPLSTRSIVVGKWWGSFRDTIPVLIWPALLAGIHATQSGRWIRYLLLLGLVTANCAVITSLGLVAATWVSRIGRAAALSVSAYLLFSIGWVWLVVLVTTSPRGTMNSEIPLLMGSPPYGALVATLAVAPGELRVGGGSVGTMVGTLAWTAIDILVALLLLVTALATFDGCLGRVSEIDGWANHEGESTANENPRLEEWFSDTEISG